MLSTLICRKKITRARIVACFADGSSRLPAVAERLFRPFGAELFVCARSRSVRVLRAASSWLVCFFIKHNNQLELKAHSGAGLPVRGVAERGFRAFFKD